MPWCLFGGSTQRKIKPTYFGIRLNSDVLWLPEDGNGISYSHLCGRVVLCLSEPIHVKDIKLHFEGTYYINCGSQFATRSHIHKKTLWKEVLFYHQIWSFLRVLSGSSYPTTLRAGNYQFPFEICVPRRIPVSVQGLGDCFIKYQLRAQIDSPNRDGNVDVIRDVKVYRACSALLFREPEIIENTWPGKLIYSIQIPNQAFLFGSVINVDFRFISLLKGLQLRKITSQLFETHKTATSSRSRVVLKDEYETPNFLDSDIVSDDGDYNLSRVLPLPSSIGDCLQTACTNIIDISHALKTEIRLTNPDGHDSSITASFPISVHFAPPPRIWHFDTPMLDIHELGPTYNWLPEYSDHALDRPGWTQPEGDNGNPPGYVQFEDLSKVPSYSTAIGSVGLNSYT